MTFGIVGFTSEDGSLQEFLQHANARTNGAVFQLARERLSATEAAKFIELVEGYHSSNTKKNHEAFVRFAIRNPQDDPDLQQPRPKSPPCSPRSIPFPSSGTSSSRPRARAGTRSCPDYRQDLFGSPKSRSLHTDLFCFDMTVLTNGPGKKALRQTRRDPVAR